MLAIPLAVQAAPKPAQPDLSGLWTSSSLTMLERPEAAPRRVLSEAEAGVIETRVMAADAADTDDVGGRSSEVGFWNFGGRFARIDGQVRASWLVEPDDGKLPFRPEGVAVRAREQARHSDSANPESRTASEQCLLTG